MALAILFDELIRSGAVADQAEIARRGYVSRTRLTQIMDLLCLAPKIQEELLLLGDSDLPRALTERGLRELSRLTDWDAQLASWRLKPNA
jgi:hypothetical protein